MHWPFQLIEKSCSAVIAKARPQPQRKRSYYEWLFRVVVMISRQALAQQTVDGAFERLSGTARLFLHQPGHIVVESESGAHIMMLGRKAS